MDKRLIKNENETFVEYSARCYRLKDFTFATENGVPKVVNWKNQEIDLSNYVLSEFLL